MILWSESLCPDCGSINWVYIGDVEEFVDGNAVEACECFSCKKRFWLDEDGCDEESDIDDAFTEQGRENPAE